MKLIDDYGDDKYSAGADDSERIQNFASRDADKKFTKLEKTIEKLVSKVEL